MREAEKPILELLEKNGALLKNEPFRHSYPHCWRHKTPIIFRATTQWFIGMDQPANVGKPGTEGRTLREIAQPRDQQHALLSRVGPRAHHRDDRQPPRLDALAPAQLGHAAALLPRTARPTSCIPTPRRLLEKAAELVSKGGVEAWFAASCEDFGVDPAQYRKITDTVDVWFDSGTTHFTVLRGLADQKYPADLYLEGSDQHRGWFQSSLLTGCAMDGRAPYNALLTHGFTVDGEGRKMSKSLRQRDRARRRSPTRWAPRSSASGSPPPTTRASSAISDEILKRVVESYRRIRNTLRFLLANTADFDPAKRPLPRGRSGSRSTATRSR